MNGDRQFEHLRDAPVPDGLADRLQARLPATVPPVRPLPALAARTSITLAPLALALVGWGWSKGGKGWRALDQWQQLSLGFVLALSAAALAFEMAARMSPAPKLRWRLSVVAAATALAAVLWTLAATPFEGGPLLFYPPCLAFTAAGVAIGAGLLWLWLRRGFAWRRTVWPWALGSALAGFGAVELFCPYVEAAHILTSHVLPAVAGSVIVWALARERAAPPLRTSSRTKAPHGY